MLSNVQPARFVHSCHGVICFVFMPQALPLCFCVRSLCLFYVTLAGTRARETSPSATREGIRDAVTPQNPAPLIWLTVGAVVGRRGVLVPNSPPIPAQDRLRCGWAMGPRVPSSGSSASVSCPSSGEGADAAWQGTDSLTDTVWYPVPGTPQLGFWVCLQGHHRSRSEPRAVVQTLCGNVGVN